MNQSNPHSPLTDAHLSQINTALRDIEAAEHQIVLAKMAGLDVLAAEQSMIDSKAKLLKIKQVYFPNG